MLFGIVFQLELFSFTRGTSLMMKFVRTIGDFPFWDKLEQLEFICNPTKTLTPFRFLSNLIIAVLINMNIACLFFDIRTTSLMDFLELQNRARYNYTLRIESPNAVQHQRTFRSRLLCLSVILNPTNNN